MLKKFPPVSAVFAHIFILAYCCLAQVPEINIKLLSPKDSLAEIEGEIPDSRSERFLLFLGNYADTENLSARIENLKVFDKQNREIEVKKFADGTFQAEQPFSSFSYRIKIFVPENALSSAHISWLTDTHGLLMLNDLLPKFHENAANVSLNLPPGWTLSASEKQIAEKTFQIKNIENSVFLVGQDLRENNALVGETELNFSTIGRWNFADADAVKMAGEILTEYQKIFGEMPVKNVNIFLLRFPKDIGFERWRAETRGANVMILSSPTNFQSLETQRFHEQIRHELFHLWIPNNLNLSGDYAWFYEGFAQYAALRTGVELNRITFADFLDTLEQAINLSDRRSQPISLLEASKSRWDGENSSVYARGMLIAFLADVALLRESRSKTDLLQMFRRIYQKHHISTDQTGGNAAILDILLSRPELVPIIDKYVKGSEKVDLQRDLQAAGIETIPATHGQKLQIKSKLSGHEKDLLNKLGYNNWRKFLRNSK